MVTKVTGNKAAQKSSTVLSSNATGKASKTAAASALSQVALAKTTSSKAATTASAVLRDGRTSAAAKNAAASALAQRPSAKKSKGV